MLLISKNMFNSINLLVILFGCVHFANAQSNSPSLEELFTNGIYLEDCKKNLSWELNSNYETDICNQKIHVKFKRKNVTTDSFYVFGKLKAQIGLSRFRQKKTIRIFGLNFKSADKNKIINYFDALTGIKKKVRKSPDKRGIFYTCSWKISNRKIIILDVADNHYKSATVRIFRK